MFIIDSGIINDYHDLIDGVMTFASKTCTLIYPKHQVECPNCILNPNTGRSSNIYKNGGPIYFTQGLCPYCRGDGLIYEEQTESISLVVYWNPKDWHKLSWTVNIPNNTIQIRSYFTDLQRLKKAEYLVIDTSLNTYSNYRYKLLGEPVPIGFRHRWLISMWTNAA